RKCAKAGAHVGNGESRIQRYVGVGRSPDRVTDEFAANQGEYDQGGEQYRTTYPGHRMVPYHCCSCRRAPASGGSGRCAFGEIASWRRVTSCQVNKPMLTTIAGT